ncbi:MAG: ComEC/Rec2 family competence protein [Pseudomonadota bacterium]|nr:ComEC/Rec2 family competence protein [Pseudomonadota bacterium]
MLAGCFALGIALYFVPPAEPQLRPTIMVLGLAVTGSFGLFFWRRWARWLGLLPMLTIAGFACAAWQASRLGDHLLDQTVAGETVTARIEQIVYRPDGPRFLLTDIQGEDPALAGLRRVQIKWRGNGNGDANETVATDPTALLGQQVRWRLTFLPVRAPVIPGGLDFRRQAFFRGLSAYGYSLGDPEVIGERRPSRIEAFRQNLRVRFRRHLKGDAAGLSTALVVGLRGDLSAQTRAEIRDAGLAHLLAISGLHVGMVSGALFFLVRLLAALVPGFSLRLPSHRLAALAAILGALGYFLISGGTVPTQRATIVVVLAMGAILISRRPFSLRSLGFAPLGVLLLQPAALITASFQMSFAAVLGLIVAFQFSEMRGSGTRPLTGRLLGYALGVAVSSLIATLATGLFALYHFQQLSLLGVIANVIAVPLTALWIMPALLLATLLTPLGLGLEAAPLWFASFGLEALLGIARLTSTLEGGVITTRAWPVVSLVLAGLGVWGMALLVRPLSLLATLPLALAVLLAADHAQPRAVLNAPERLLAGAAAPGPLFQFGDRPPGLVVAAGSEFAVQQLERLLNLRATDCPAPACAMGPHLWISTSAQSAGLLCQRDDSARIIVLGVAPRGACTPAQVIDSLAFSAKALGVVSQDDPGKTAENALDLRLESPERRRFWTPAPTR